MTLNRSTGLKRTAFARSERKEASAVKKLRLRKCAVKGCRKPFEPRSAWAQACSPECAAIVAQQKREADERKADKVRKDAIEPLEYWLKRAEKACNAYIRKRDEGQGCISCGRHNAEVWNAGHFISVGANRTLRFHEDNIHLQCARPCNKDKGGNIHEYRKGLLLKIGAERLAWLDGWHETVKMTRAKAQEIEATYKFKLKQLKSGQESIAVGSSPITNKTN
jgi:hypothetical protein